MNNVVVTDYWSDEDFDGRGSPVTITESLGPLTPQAQVLQQEYFKFVGGITSAHDWLLEFEVEIRQFIAYELFGLRGTEVDGALDRWPAKRLKIFGRLTRISLNQFLPLFLSTFFKFVIYQNRRKLRLQTPYRFFADALQQLRDVVFDRYFERLAQNNSDRILPLDHRTCIEHTFIFLFTTLHEKTRYKRQHRRIPLFLRLAFQQRQHFLPPHHTIPLSLDNHPPLIGHLLEANFRGMTNAVVNE